MPRTPDIDLDRLASIMERAAGSLGAVQRTMLEGLGQISLMDDDRATAAGEILRRQVDELERLADELDAWVHPES